MECRTEGIVSYLTDKPYLGPQAGREHRAVGPTTADRFGNTLGGRFAVLKQTGIRPQWCYLHVAADIPHNAQPTACEDRLIQHRLRASSEPAKEVLGHVCGPGNRHTQGDSPIFAAMGTTPYCAKVLLAAKIGTVPVNGYAARKPLGLKSFGEFAFEFLHQQVLHDQMDRLGLRGRLHGHEDRAG